MRAQDIAFDILDRLEGRATLVSQADAVVIQADGPTGTRNVHIGTGGFEYSTATDNEIHDFKHFALKVLRGDDYVQHDPESDRPEDRSRLAG